ncbi:hypothetical protein [Pseudomonas sp. Irchel 3F5]|uniref:hypothetical protein n=1 Tax=Pseudomonas sp. Irchel 3F5 TaxID=2009002 RepID=UPI0011407F6C|nr:hypothetical protein [Pseudomonas sp. Irchel 3F5]
MVVAEAFVLDTHTSPIGGLKKDSEVPRGETPRWEFERKIDSTTSAVARSLADKNSSVATVLIPPNVHLVKESVLPNNRAAVWEKVIQTWEGRVVCNVPGEREFVAVISDVTCKSNPNEEVVIGYESVMPSDIDLITEGAVFFWNIGRYRTISNQKLNPSRNHFEIRFRRLPPISEEKLREIKAEAQRLTSNLYADKSA